MKRAERIMRSLRARKRRQSLKKLKTDLLQRFWQRMKGIRKKKQKQIKKVH